MAISYPPIFINDYLSQKIPSALGRERFSAGIMRFFPTAPTDIESLTETFPEASADVFAVYDRMFKMRRKAFPHIKDEQLLYYFYNPVTGLYKEEFLPVYFHDIKIYQLEETRDIIDFGTARTYAGNKIIIDYCYHTKGYPKGTLIEGSDPARPRYEDASNDSYNDTTI